MIVGKNNVKRREKQQQQQQQQQNKTKTAITITARERRLSPQSLPVFSALNTIRSRTTI